MARVVIQNALFFGRKKASALVIPWSTYTDPEIAHVGLHERQAHERGHDVATFTVPLHEIDRAVLDGDADGFARVHAERRTGRILGATLVAGHAGEMIGEMSLAITAKLMEDLELSRRLSKVGRIRTVPCSVRVSGRRFQARPVRYGVLMNVFPLLYRLGVPSHVLARMYGRAR